MMKERLRLLLPGAAIWILAVPPASARPGDGIRLGSMTAHPYVGLNLTYSDNVFQGNPQTPEDVQGLTPEDAALDVTLPGPVDTPQPLEINPNVSPPVEGDYYVTLRLGVGGLQRLGAEQGALTFDVNYSTDRYDQYTAANRSVVQFRIGARYTTARDVTILVSDSFSATTGWDVDAARTSQDVQRRDNTFRGSVDWVVGPRTFVGVNGWTRTATADKEDIATSDDYEVGGQAGYSITPKTSVMLIYHHGWVKRDAGTNVTFRGNSDYDNLSIGVAGRYRTKLTGRLTIGYDHRSYEQLTAQEAVNVFTPEEISVIQAAGYTAEEFNAIDDTADNWIGSLSVAYQMRPRTSLNLTGNRTINTAAFQASNNFIETRLSLGLSHSFPSDFGLRLFGEWSVLDYELPALVRPPGEPPRLVSRKDDRYRLGASLTYAPNAWLSVAVGLDWTDQTSTVGTTEYDRTQYYVRMTATY